jgi:TolA-binding protein
VSLAQEAAAVRAAPEVERNARDRFIAEAILYRQRAMQRRAWPKLAFLAAAAAVAVAAWVMRTPALTYEVRGGSSLDSPYVGAQAGSPAEIMFSDGSQVQADPGARLRIDDKQDNGARVFLERGVANARIAHHTRTHWVFLAGPFEVHVTGTKLTLGWDPIKEELDLTLHEGSVEVRGPLGRKPIAVRAGQRLVAQLRDRTMLTEQVSSATGSPDANGQVGTADESERADKAETAPEARVEERGAKALASNSALAAHTTKGQAAHRDSWQSLVMRGEFELVIAAAQSKGVDACLESCSAQDLRALADAARYANRVELAEQCLLGLRQRFSDSGSSHAAAFLLGRTSESRGNTSKAQQWYERYLEESPDGEFAADALAGKMRAVVAQHGKAAARPLALEYLRRYPDGVHAISARRIAGPH